MPKLMKKKILSRGDLGGISLLISGNLGAGKTSLTADILKRLYNRRDRDDRPSNERFFWRGRATCQWTKMDGVIDKRILVPDTASIEFYKDEGKPEVDLWRFNTLRELWELSSPDCLNVFYLPVERLIDFLEWIEEEVFDWTTVAIDEASDISPYGASGEKYEWTQRVADVLKETRKTRISIIANSQDFSDIQWFVLRKFMAYGFLQGSRPVSTSPIWRSAIRGLDDGEAWISMGNEFEKITFPPYKGEDIRAKIKYSEDRVE
ncbi:hypothetical protein AKJ66_00400 [candidate division MSBL1 archaeon SCGC-AAA259E22]|uniref:Zona occludens toxin N-terminal domain-containing protein n=1 Tax=candidate division MSBL1 archaeon SCGC-AAA259E22 TaxID=1698265 RepID=A0A133UI33_9EURY|nr:hypothetical protein AKJ66_00400 [candidate division MSBL1 archaeon SCGC-AAA259E22]